jgi:hypothetical protein
MIYLNPGCFEEFIRDFLFKSISPQRHTEKSISTQGYKGHKETQRFLPYNFTNLINFLLKKSLASFTENQYLLQKEVFPANTEVYRNTHQRGGREKKLL